LLLNCDIVVEFPDNIFGKLFALYLPVTPLTHTQERMTSMFTFTDETMWLTVTNVVLGVVVVVACVVVVRVFAAELIGRLRESFAVQHSTGHELFVSDLGLTMADGGERIDKKNNGQPSDLPAATPPQQKID
jgi:hypothetical protein